MRHRFESNMNKEIRDTLPLRWLAGFTADLRFILRGLRRDRVYGFAAITMLALAIGLNVTVFVVMNTMLFRGFPVVRENARMVYLQERDRAGLCCISYVDFEQWRAQAKSFDGLAFILRRPITFSDGLDGRSVDAVVEAVSTNAFSLLGVRPILGRDFNAADEAAGAMPVVILSYRFWDSAMGKRADIVGHQVQINSQATTVIGVMPEGFDFPDQENFWIPLAHTPELQRRQLTPGGYIAFGRLREGVTIAVARAEIETINRGLAAAYPDSNRAWSLASPHTRNSSSVRMLSRTMAPSGPAPGSFC